LVLTLELVRLKIVPCLYCARLRGVAYLSCEVWGCFFMRCCDVKRWRKPRQTSRRMITIFSYQRRHCQVYSLQSCYTCHPLQAKSSQFLTMVLDDFWKGVKLNKRSKIIQSRPASIISATANRVHVKTTQDTFLKSPAVASLTSSLA